MSGVGECEYYVIQFLEVPYKGIADIVCVPTSWVQSYGAVIVKVSYPVEEPSLTEQRVKNQEIKSGSWKTFLSVVRLITDNYEKAKIYIQQEINKSKKNKKDVDGKNIQDRTNKSDKKNGGHTSLSPKAIEKTNITTQNATSSATIDNDDLVVGMIDSLGWCVSTKSASTVTLKRKADPDKENHNKRFRANESCESDNQVAGPSSKALDRSSDNHLSPTPEDSDEDLCTQETPVEKVDDSTEMRRTVNQNPSKTNHSLDPKIIAQLATSPIFAKWCKLMQELQEVFDNSMFKELINKLLNKDCSAPQNNDSIASTSCDTTQGDTKLNKEKINEKPAEERDSDDKDQPPKKNSCPKQFEEGLLSLADIYDDTDTEDDDLDLVKVEELPPEYDANDSRWTLNYREPAPELVELMPHTGVYVCPAYRLPNFKSFSTRFALARRLLSEIFNKNALSICKLTDKRDKAIDCDETYVSRPALDQHALTVLINYVIDHAKKEGWSYIDNRSILMSLDNKMRNLRVQTKYPGLSSDMKYLLNSKYQVRFLNYRDKVSSLRRKKMTAALSD